MIEPNRIPRPTTRLGLQIPNFTYDGVAPERLFGAVADQAVAAEQSGFDSIFVMDHFFQLPMLGPTDNEMFEAYTLLGALAARTQSARLGTLVTGVTYRHPAVLAKILSTLDVISGGRALLGIGAAWFDVEHHALGIPFPPITERFEHLRDALEITTRMFTRPTSTYDGVHHSIAEAHNAPSPIHGRIPVMIGGAGERKTFRLAAEYADELNAICNFAEIPSKLEALQGHLDDLGRSRSDITVSTLGFLAIADTEQAARRQVLPYVQALGLDPDDVFADRTAAEATLGRVIWGEPDQVADQVRRLMGLGLDSLIVNMPFDHDPDSVALAGETLTKALAG
ncbi:MAG: LLM class F420-dependent oxidoreductase [Acidimicrobiaceae bacterium]|nr:LLM class F420-dependent oxidoreductase [Acidimicrobiaceae bacterium]